MDVLRLRNKKAEGPDNRAAAIPLESARVCSVCWTVHQADACPECQARQWRALPELLQALGLEPWAGAGTRVADRGAEAGLAAS